MPRRPPRRPAPPRALRIAAARQAVTQRSNPRAIEEVSAGGLVVDLGATARVALIGRRNRAGRTDWCLPKGHLEKDETPAQAAVREIAEETGIHGRITHEIGTIDYWFSHRGQRIHKTVHHFLLIAAGGQLSLDGDPDQEADDVAWVDLADLPTTLAFVNERRIAAVAADILARS